MNSTRETSLARLPRSGDKLVDWIFKQFVFFLRKEKTHIKRKKRIGYAGCAGMMCPQDEAGHTIDILISTTKKAHRSRDDELGTLIHELSHIVFWKTREKFIEQIERILIARFTTEQKNYLKSFIPRHEVKSV